MYALNIRDLSNDELLYVSGGDGGMPTVTVTASPEACVPPPDRIVIFVERANPYVSWLFGLLGAGFALIAVEIIDRCLGTQISLVRRIQAGP